MSEAGSRDGSPVAVLGVQSFNRLGRDCGIGTRIRREPLPFIHLSTDIPTARFRPTIAAVRSADRDSPRPVGRFAPSCHPPPMMTGGTRTRARTPSVDARGIKVDTRRRAGVFKLLGG